MDGAIPGPWFSPERKRAMAIPLLVIAGGILVALRIEQRGEIWLDRTCWIVAITSFGALVASLGISLIPRGWLSRRKRIPALLMIGFGFTVLFMLGMTAGYILQFMLFSGQYDPNPERPLRGAIIGALQTMVLFLISSPAYLLPWPLPTLAALAAWVFTSAPTKTPPAG
jgi:hypothetical protein